MNRTTIMLPEDLKAKAVAAARKRGVSLGELIRQAISRALRRDEPAARDPDPIFRVAEVYEGPSPPDLAANHDRYLYGDGDGE